MISLGKIKLNGSPKIALVISDQESVQTLAVSKADILEVRVDQFSKIDTAHVEAKLKEYAQMGHPLILTIRNQKSEGGPEIISDELKFELFQIGIPCIDAIDIELSSPLLEKVTTLAKAQKRVVIISSHNFQETPPAEKLEEILSRAKQAGADVVKIAAQSKDHEDVFRLLEFTLAHRNDNIITLAMGERGSISRLVFPLVGSLLTYSCLGKPFAPGQIPLETLQQHFQFYYGKF